ncbi:YeeE/YedE thiosulfate transporter family protein [Limibacter armeniacum]|uniref:YeeE/YedE family protein n=1 Tax=Limibacter armeniacum TaxID=466084 RepID=UPI002FE55D44
MNNFLTTSWEWYVAGPLITLTMFLLLYFGKSFGISSTLRTMCAIGGAGKVADFFRFDWRSQIWNLLFVVGTIIGGFLAHIVFKNPEPVQLSADTLQLLTDLEVDLPKAGALIPANLFSWESLFTLRGFIMMVGGGFLVGFGTRYAGGCTSGHAISGLSNLQLPSLIAVIGFFIGGLVMTYFLLPLILAL